jgi:hypothetical protein
MKLQHERRLAKGRRGQQVDGVPAVCLRSWPQAMNRLTLVCALLAAVPHVSGCGVAQLPRTHKHGGLLSNAARCRTSSVTKG